jgi:hypothetical protein
MNSANSSFPASIIIFKILPDLCMFIILNATYSEVMV